MAASRHNMRGKGGRFVKAPKPADLMDDGLTSGLLSYGAKLSADVNESMYRTAGDIEDWMKENAPWNDRTTDARSGLTAAFIPDKKKPTIMIYHTVDYGVWLEVRWNGRYAILTPALEYWGPQVVARIQAVI